MKIQNPELVELIKTLLSSGLKKLDWIRKGCFRTSTDQQTTEHRKIILVIDGLLSMESSSGNKNYTSGEGFVLNPYAWYEAKNSKFLALEFVICESRIEIFLNSPDIKGIQKPLHVLVRAEDDPRNIKIEGVYSAFLKHDADDEADFRAILFNSIMDHIVQLQKNPWKIARLSQVFETLAACVMDNFLDQSFTRMAVSAKFDISESYINTMIKWGMGCNFKDLLTLKRLEYSRKALKENDMQIKDLAPLFGYADSTIFIINFKNHYKLTPNRMRRILRKDVLTEKEKKSLQYMDKLEEISPINSKVDLSVKDENEKTLVLMSNMSDKDITVFRTGDSDRVLRNIPENTRVILSASKGEVLKVQDKTYKVSDKPCFVNYT